MEGGPIGQVSGGLDGEGFVEGTAIDQAFGSIGDVDDFCDEGPYVVGLQDHGLGREDEEYRWFTHDGAVGVAILDGVGALIRELGVGAGIGLSCGTGDVGSVFIPLEAGGSACGIQGEGVAYGDDGGAWVFGDLGYGSDCKGCAGACGIAIGIADDAGVLACLG